MRARGSSRKRFAWKNDRARARRTTPRTLASTNGAPCSHWSRGPVATPKPSSPGTRAAREARAGASWAARAVSSEARSVPPSGDSRRSRPRSRGPSAGIPATASRSERAARFMRSESWRHARTSTTRCVPSCCSPRRRPFSPVREVERRPHPPPGLRGRVDDHRPLPRRPRAAQRLEQHGLLHAQLRLVVEVLVGAAPAPRHVRAGRSPPGRGGGQHLDEGALGPAGVHLGDPCAHAVAGVSPRDEHDAPVHAPEAAPAVDALLDHRLDQLAGTKARRLSARRASPPSPALEVEEAQPREAVRLEPPPRDRLAAQLLHHPRRHPGPPPLEPRVDLGLEGCPPAPVPRRRRSPPGAGPPARRARRRPPRGAPLPHARASPGRARPPGGARGGRAPARARGPWRSRAARTPRPAPRRARGRAPAPISRARRPPRARSRRGSPPCARGSTRARARRARRGSPAARPAAEARPAATSARGSSRRSRGRAGSPRRETKYSSTAW